MDPVRLLEFVGLVFALNLVPAFGPPTWTLVVFFRIRYEVPLPALVLLGALAATVGRVVLALVARHFGDRLPARRRADLDALRDAVERRKSATIGAFAFFAVSPIPSAQMFLAAGLAGLALRPLAVAFFLGRLISYSLYGTAASLAARRIEEVLRAGPGSPAAIALQIALIGGVVAIVFIPWRRLFARLDRRARERAELS